VEGGETFVRGVDGPRVRCTGTGAGSCPAILFLICTSRHPHRGTVSSPWSLWSGGPGLLSTTACRGGSGARHARWETTHKIMST